MPVKIKHKQLDKVEVIPYTVWVSQYNHQLWDLVKMWDVGKIYNVQGEKPVYQSTVDKNAFLDAMKHPVNQNALLFEPIPDVDNSPDLETAEIKVLKALAGQQTMWIKDIQIEGWTEDNVYDVCIMLSKADYIKLTKQSASITPLGRTRLANQLTLLNEHLKVVAERDHDNAKEFYRSKLENDQAERLLKTNLQTNPVKPQATSKSHDGTGWLKNLFKWIATNVILAIAIGVVIGLSILIIWGFMANWFRDHFPNFHL